MRSLVGRAWWHVWRRHRAQKVRVTTHTDETFEGVLAWRGGRHYQLALAGLYDAGDTLHTLGWVEIPRENVLCVVAL